MHFTCIERPFRTTELTKPFGTWTPLPRCCAELRLKVDDGHGTVLKLRRVDVGEVAQNGIGRL